MTLDKRSLDMLLNLNDDQLRKVIARLAKDAGLDPATLQIGDAQLQGLRAALSMATDSDLSRAGELIKNYKAGKKSPPRG